MRGLLVANGIVSEQEKKMLQNARFELIVAADAGVNNALFLGFQPHAIVGDLDSLAVSHSAVCVDPVEIVENPDQGSNDLEKALLYCERLGVTELSVVGTNGGRLDHTLCNLSVLARFRKRLHLQILDGFGRVEFVEDSYEGRGRVGQCVSLFPCGRVLGVQTEGLQYPLQGEELFFGTREGLSNVLTAERFQVRVQEGLLLLYVLN